MTESRFVKPSVSPGRGRWEIKEVPGVLAGRAGNLSRGETLELGDFLANVRQVGRFVALAPAHLGCEVRTVGLQQ